MLNNHRTLSLIAFLLSLCLLITSCGTAAPSEDGSTSSDSSSQTSESLIVDPDRPLSPDYTRTAIYGSYEGTSYLVSEEIYDTSGNCVRYLDYAFPGKPLSSEEECPYDIRIRDDERYTDLLFHFAKEGTLEYIEKCFELADRNKKLTVRYDPTAKESHLIMEAYNQDGTPQCYLTSTATTFWEGEFYDYEDQGEGNPPVQRVYSDPDLTQLIENNSSYTVTEPPTYKADEVTIESDLPFFTDEYDKYMFYTLWDPFSAVEVEITMDNYQDFFEVIPVTMSDKYMEYNKPDYFYSYGYRLALKEPYVSMYLLFSPYIIPDVKSMIKREEISLYLRRGQLKGNQGKVNVTFALTCEDADVQSLVLNIPETDTATLGTHDFADYLVDKYWLMEPGWRNLFPRIAGELYSFSIPVESMDSSSFGPQTTFDPSFLTDHFTIEITDIEGTIALFLPHGIESIR